MGLFLVPHIISKAQYHICWLPSISKVGVSELPMWPLLFAGWPTKRCSLGDHVHGYFYAELGWGPCHWKLFTNALACQTEQQLHKRGKWWSACWLTCLLLKGATLGWMTGKGSQHEICSFKLSGSNVFSMAHQQKQQERCLIMLSCKGYTVEFVWMVKYNDSQDWYCHFTLLLKWHSMVFTLSQYIGVHWFPHIFSFERPQGAICWMSPSSQCLMPAWPV